MKNVIIVGGGGSGAQFAKGLAQKLDSSKYNLILISSRNYFTHLPGTLRMLTTDEKNLEDRVLIPYDKLFANGKGTFKQATVNGVFPASSGGAGEGKASGGTITLDNGETLEYEVLVLATGSKWEGGIDLPINLKDTKHDIDGWRKRIRDSKGVIIVGGGAVGLEYAGEIRDTYPDKKITIVHRGSQFLGDVYPQKYRKMLDKAWTQRNIHIVFNDEILELPEYPASNVVTKNGVRLDGDLVIPSRGGRPNTEFLSSLPILTEEGRIKVDPTLQVTNHPGIFAMGDIISWKEVKQVAKYPGHAKIIQANILSYLEGKPLTAIYKGTFEGIAVTNGARGGSGYLDILWGITLGNWLTTKLKSDDLFITPTYKAMGY